MKVSRGYLVCCMNVTIFEPLHSGLSIERVEGSKAPAKRKVWQPVDGRTSA